MEMRTVGVQHRSGVVSAFAICNCPEARPNCIVTKVEYDFGALVSFFFLVR